MRVFPSRRPANRRGVSRRAEAERRWPRFRLGAPVWLSFFFIATGLLVGGPLGTFSPSFLVLLIIGGTLVVTVTAAGWADAFQTLPLPIRLLAAGWVALPFCQLVPLPPSWWQALPGVGLRLEVLSAFGLQDRWMPLTVSPIDTAYSATTALAMLGLLVSALHVEDRTLRAFLWTTVGVLLLGAAIGVIQFASGGSALQIYAAADHEALVGFFTNKNHMGLALACLPPLIHSLVPRRFVQPRDASLRPNPVRRDAVGFAAGSVVLLSLIVATNSRAGLLLGAGAIAITALRRYSERWRLVAIVLVALVASAVLASFAVPSIAHLGERLGHSTEDVRGSFLAWSRPLAGIYGPVGAGLGSFPDIFPPSEQLAWVKPTRLNAVHNDYVQLYIEGGAAAVLLLASSLAALAWAAVRTVRAGRRAAGQAADIAATGATIILLFIGHSIVDYPARRAAELVILVLAIACLLRPLVHRPPPAQ